MPQPKVIPLRPSDEPQPRPAPASAKPTLPVYLTPEELADLLRLPSVETVYQWRRKRTGPRGFRAGRHLRYDLADVQSWIAHQQNPAA